MKRYFNVVGMCDPDIHYMVNIESRLKEIKKLIDNGDYFTINRARQYGKTTTLNALVQYLSDDYEVIDIDFQMMSQEDFNNESSFVMAFAREFLITTSFKDSIAETAIHKLQNIEAGAVSNPRLATLFSSLSELCYKSSKPVVLIIDEVDSATNNQVFLDFLSQLRGYYIHRKKRPTFQSVILAGVYDIKNLKYKIRPNEQHKTNSPWNIATDFNIEMSFSVFDIKGMLEAYEKDCHTGMNLDTIATLIYDYTSGYPFLVSKLCKFIDEIIDSWTNDGVKEAAKLLLNDKNTLFESLSDKLTNYPELNAMLHSLLFTGRTIAYNFYEPSINIATMFGFVKNKNGTLVIANRIFETWLYNLYLSTSEMQSKDIYTASLRDKNQFIADGHLNIRLILEKFVVHFNDLYGDSNETFLEEEGRKYFLLYLRPIINGVGNYYIESQTRELKRTDVIIDYRGEQYIIEMKIWHGNEYNSRGEEQLVEYLDYYHKNEGYMVSFNFNKKKRIGVREIVIGEKKLIEAVV